MYYNDMNDQHIIKYVFDSYPQRKNMLGDSAWRDFDFTILHTHEYWEVLFIKEGDCDHYYNDKKMTMTKNDLMLIRPSDKHYFVKTTKHFSHINFIVRDSVIKEYCDYLSPTLYVELLSARSLPATLGMHDAEKVMKYNNNISFTVEDSEKNHFYTRAFASYIVELIKSSTCLSDNSPYEWLNKFIVSLYHPKNLDKFPKDVTAETGFSHQYVLRIFKKFTGKTLIDYMNEIKLNRACDLLLYHDLSTLEIANRLGFCSLSHFNHLFKDRYGISPKQYVKIAKNNL